MNEKIKDDGNKPPDKFNPHTASIHPAPLGAPYETGKRRGRDVYGNEYEGDLAEIAKVHDIYGREFRILRDIRFPKGQQLCTRILKGIVPVSDIVRFEEGKHFFRESAEALHGSYFVPIEQSAPISDIEAQANQLILSYIFKDSDKGLGQNRSKVAYFDFEYMPIFFMNQNIRSISGEFKLRARQVMLTAPKGVITQKVLREDKGYYGKPIEVRHALHERLLALQNRFSGKEGEKYLRTIVNSIGAPLHEIISFPPSVLARRYLSRDRDNYLFKLFYKTLINRIADSLKAVQTYEASQTGK